MHQVKILTNILMIIAIILTILPSKNYSQVLEKGCCNLVDQDSGPCLLEINGTNFNIYSEGIITYNPTKENAKSIQVILPETFYIEAVKSYTYNDEIIFILGITDDDAGSTLVALFDPKHSTLKWTYDLGAFNPSPPLVSGGSVYIAGIGTVAKIDVKNGRTVWKHTGLYESDTTAFNSFVKPFKQGAMIIFKEEKISSYDNYRGIREIRVDDKSGKILK